MANHSFLGQLIVSLSMISLLAACGTPGSVRDLAKKTSDNTVSVALSLDNFARSTAKDAERRVNNIARQTSSIDEESLRLERAIALADKAGNRGPVSRYNEIKTLSDTWAQKEADRKQVGEAKRQEVLADQDKLETESAAFREIGAQLLELSKENSGKSRVEFVVGFVKDVRDDLKEAKDGASPEGQETAE